MCRPKIKEEMKKEDEGVMKELLASRQNFMYYV